jgi:short subunit dehydrogenase-like uncharacterized protein
MPTFDLVLFGASGFTGRLTAEYLLRRGSAARIALAGRDRGKLEALQRELGSELPILTADASDRAALESIASQTKVICSTVGPYAKYGSPLVAACAASGTDYCDITGEPHWIRRMIDEHHAEAERTGARIVHCCGFDSIPSDLGVHVLQAHARKAYGVACDRVLLAVRKMRGGASGGTIATMLGTIEEARGDRAVRKSLLDPYALHPDGERNGPEIHEPRGVAWSEDLRAWTAPFVMAGINTKIVRRSNALAQYPYGREFRYSEVMSFPQGPRGLVRASALTAGLGMFIGMAAVGPLRSLMQRTLLPKPGEGPSRDKRESGFFEMQLVGKGTGLQGVGFTVRGRVTGKGDPGYAATARMLGESALSLALDEKATAGGVLTPAYALGDRLVERLRSADMTFTTEG